MDPSSSSSGSKYPHPTDVNVVDFVSIKLSPNNYFMWRKLMLGFIESQGLTGFIFGTTTVPAEKITVPDDGSTGNGATKEIDNKDYRDWKKSDGLVRRWILSTLNEDILVHVVRCKTAKDVWAMLAKVFSQPLHKLVSNVMLNIDEGKNLSQYLPLHKAALAGDWETAEKFIQKEPEAVRAIITGFSETALFVAVRSTKRNHFMKKLVEGMLPEDLAKVDSAGATAFHIAAVVGNIEAAKLLVQKNPDLPNIWDSMKGLAIHRAALFGQKEMVLYLLTVTKEDGVPKPFEDEPGVRLVHSLIASGFYDIALYLLKRHPQLACGDPSPLESLAIMPSAFPSGTRLNNLQFLIYSCVPVELEKLEKQRKVGDIENPADSCLASGWKKFLVMFWEVAEIFVPQIKDIREKKLKHHQARELVKRLCMEVVKLDYSKASSLLEPPLKTATRVGIHEVVEEILVSFPSAVYHKNEKDQSLFHIAILNRRENVFNLIYQFECKHIFLSSPDVSMNNGLHLAGNLEPQQQLNLRARAAGAALQVQRELQWFKEVEKFTLPQSKEQGNSENKTPALVFTEKHQELVKEGEQWMKDTANSCTIIATLIATIVFAAAITVPGGNNSEGLPFFSHEPLFLVFAVSDALALFASTSSVIMFLSVLTSRYGEDDFLYALPKRLILGLVTLFLSIISMMVAFSATIYLVFGYRKLSTLIPMISLACLPVTLFAFLQFPLLLDMIKSTYKPGIFGKQSDRILF